MTEDEWLTTPDPELLSLYLAETASDRKLRLLAAAFCRQLMAWNKEPRVLEALCRVERHADGQLADSTMEKWSRQMWRAMGDRREAQYVICCAACVACQPRRYPAFVQFFHSMVGSNAGFSVEMKQGLPTLVRGILHEILGNPFRPITLNPFWLTPTVSDLARAIYDERAFGHFPILADALEDGGCSDTEILGHMRGPATHVLGCWALDLILARS
jgi:hypothetical protein